MSLRCRVWGWDFFLGENFGERVLWGFKMVRVPRKHKGFY